MDDVAYVNDCLQARLRQYQLGQQELHESIVRIQGKLNRFSAGLKENLEYMKLYEDKNVRKILNQLWPWTAERFVEAQHKNFYWSKFTINHNMSGGVDRLNQVKQKLVAAVSRLVVPVDNLEKFLAVLVNEACQGVQKSELIDGAEISFRGATDSNIEN